MIAKEMSLPWRAVESMHWHMGAEEMAQRANVAVFQSVFPSPTVTYSKNPPTGSKRKAPSVSPTLAGGGASDSSAGGAPLNAEGGPVTRSRRSDSSRGRNDSKFGEDKGDYGSVLEDHSPGGVPLPMEAEAEQSASRFDVTPGSNGDGSWRDKEVEARESSVKGRSESLSSGRSGGSVHLPEMKQEI